MMSLINGSRDHPNYQDISGLSCGMNVTSTTAVSCSVATSSSESLLNDGEKPNQPKRFLFPEYDYGKISMSVHFSTKQKWYL